jgi:2-amino-4-hydroxy-6-hydroxymethyldihydropteridine diphosphokinase
VGSNIDPEQNITQAMDRLQGYTHIKGVSTFYRTSPIGRPEQSAFLNGIFQSETDIAPRKLKFGILRHIEAELGRVRTEDKYAARTIDLDIALYGDRAINEDDLVIPDPDIRKRSFIAIPLMELNPSLILPDTGAAISSLDIVTEVKDLEGLYIFTESLRRKLKYE